MSRQLREHIRRQLRVLLENKEKGYIPKDDKFEKGSLEDFNFRDKVADKPRDSSIRNQYKTAMKSAIDDMDGEVPSLGEVLKKMREDAKSEEFKKVIQLLVLFQFGCVLILLILVIMNKQFLNFIKLQIMKNYT